MRQFSNRCKEILAHPIAWTFIALVIVISLGVTIYSETIHHAVEATITEKSTKNLSFGQRLIVIEQEINQTAPKMVDAATRLDGVKAGIGTLTYHYTLVNVDAPDRETLKQLRVTEHDRLKTMVMTNTDFDELRQGNTIIIFDYKDRNGNPYVKVAVTPDDYHGNKKVEEINSNFE